MAAVLLASGGLDSSVLAAQNPGAIHLHVRYGQRNWIQEERASSRVAAHYGAERVVVTFGDFATLATSTLTGSGGFMVGPATVVPNRNAMLISLGVSLAITRGAGTVLIGCNASDHDVYPDCRPGFIDQADRLARYVSDEAVHVEAPLVSLTKSEIGDLVRALGVPVDLTWSCYSPRSVGWGQHEPCGTCGACAERSHACT